MFDRVVIVDWSAANTPTSARKLSDAIWIAECGAAGAVETHHRTRAGAEGHLRRLIAAGGRLLIGFDFAFGYPHGFAQRLTGVAHARAVWQWLAGRIVDGADNANNRFAVAAGINLGFGGLGPFWSHPQGQDYPGLTARKAGIDFAALGLDEFRKVEGATPGAKSVWMLCNPGAVGSQSLMGLPMISRLSSLPGVAVWPFEAADAPVVLAEVYPSLLGGLVADEVARAGIVKDQAQVRLLARALWRLGQGGQLADVLAAPDVPDLAEEGWILGAGHQARLMGALA